ncbi:protein of unknown function [Magnetospirillum sp. XM-1]|nr:protein of unknown function [Magnetospirillum sp. XM-1]
MINGPSEAPEAFGEPRIDQQQTGHPRLLFPYSGDALLKKGRITSRVSLRIRSRPPTLTKKQWSR